jgi:hypothetical protein
MVLNKAQSNITSNTTNVADETQPNESDNNTEKKQQNAEKSSNTITETPLFDFLPRRSSTEKNQHTAKKSGMRNTKRKIPIAPSPQPAKRKKAGEQTDDGMQIRTIAGGVTVEMNMTHVPFFIQCNNNSIFIQPQVNH